MKSKNARLQQLKQLLAITAVNFCALTPVIADPLDSIFKKDNFGGQDMKTLYDMFDKSKHDYRKRDDKEDSDESLQIKETGQQTKHTMPNPQFNGSEFNASTFTDTDFSKNSYQDLFAPSDSSSSDLDSPFRKKDISKTIYDDDDDILTIDRNKKKERILDKAEYKRIIKPIYYQPGDWVPSGLDSTWNGGFTTPPFNGSPVPYRLNGHVDDQRKTPWQD